MASVLEDLYFGRIHPCERCSSQEEQQLIEELAECYERLLETMTEEQREHFERFKDCLQEIGMLAERDMFMYGFRLGMRLMVEALTAKSISK